ncbi:hypothetical protein MKX01_031877 [Papaver californicum]|nr:hypothetical protein MKX01_031877 [Papaver californicum]
MNTQQLDDHIIMFPFMAQGHIIPFLALAKLISQRKPNTKITLVSTPLYIKYLQLTLNSETTTTYKNISLAQLPFSGTDDELPPNSENTDSLPSHLISRLFNDIAKRIGTYHFSFTTSGGYGTAVYFSMYLYLLHRKNDDVPIKLLKNFTCPNSRIPVGYISQLPVYLREADKESPFVKFFQKQISLSLKSDEQNKMMLCNIVEEIEFLGLEILRNYMDSKPVWTIGPLLPPFLLGNNGNTTNKSVNCIEWLNHQKLSSVLYISFGSQNTIRASKMMKLSLGLENSGKCCIWVLRPPSELDIKSKFRSEWLPEGFVKRMKESEKGLLIKKNGAFLNHCGWNSLLDSLSQGVPIIGWPLAAEQCYNSKMMEEEMGVCMELARVDGQVVSEDVKKIIGQVMDSNKGEAMRKKATVIREKIRDAVTDKDKGEGDHQKGSSVRSIDHFSCNRLTKLRYKKLY